MARGDCNDKESSTQSSSSRWHDGYLHSDHYADKIVGLSDEVHKIRWN